MEELFTSGCRDTGGELIKRGNKLICDYEDMRIILNKETRETKIYENGELVRWGELKNIEYEPLHTLSRVELEKKLKEFLGWWAPSLLLHKEEFGKILKAQEWKIGKETASMKINFKEISPFVIESLDSLIFTTPTYKEVAPKFKRKWLEKRELARRASLIRWRVR
ncbi:MAG: hypothetical protein ACTSWZ_07690 [Candidatus Heimdallarchaeaceae archaeon]